MITYARCLIIKFSSEYSSETRQTYLANLLRSKNAKKLSSGDTGVLEALFGQLDGSGKMDSKDVFEGLDRDRALAKRMSKGDKLEVTHRHP